MDDADTTASSVAQMMGLELATEPPEPGSPEALAFDIYDRVASGETTVEEGAKQLKEVMMPIWEANGVARYLDLE